MGRNFGEGRDKPEFCLSRVANSAAPTCLAQNVKLKCKYMLLILRISAWFSLQYLQNDEVSSDPDSQAVREVDIVSLIVHFDLFMICNSIQACLHRTMSGASHATLTTPLHKSWRIMSPSQRCTVKTRAD